MNTMTNTIVIDREDTPAALTVRELFAAGSTPGNPQLLSFHDVAEEVTSLRTLLDPQDIERPVGQSAVRYAEDGSMALMFRAPNGAEAWEAPLSFTGNGYRQFGARVLGSTKALSFIDRQAQRDQTGRSMAEINWAVEIAAQSEDVMRLRTIQLPGQQGRSIRAAVSQSYGCFDNVDVLEALLPADGIDQLHVISANISEDAMRIRFLLNPEDAGLFGRNGALTRETLNKPIPMAEIWNSEVGGSSVRARSGLFTARCTNGQMNSFTGRSDWRWAHRGGGDFNQRISQGLADAVRSFRVEASGAVERHAEASAVAINNAAEFLRQFSGQAGMSAGMRDAAITALSNEVAVAQPIADADAPSSLQSVVDAVTWAAQSAGSLFAQRDAETAATKLLDRGLLHARRNNGSITVEAA